jgi:hypothetical protein
MPVLFSPTAAHMLVTPPTRFAVSSPRAVVVLVTISCVKAGLAASAFVVR